MYFKQLAGEIHDRIRETQDFFHIISCSFSYLWPSSAAYKHWPLSNISFVICKVGKKYIVPRGLKVNNVKWLEQGLALISTQ